MSCRVRVVLAAAVLAICGAAVTLEAQTTVTQVYPGITIVSRVETMPFFQCPGCGPPPNPRLARMKIALIDLTAPEIRFRLTAPTRNLPIPVCPAPPWPCPSPLFEVVRKPTLTFLNEVHGQLAVNAHFFAPFPVGNSAAERALAAYAYAIGLAASRGDVYSAFESPVQNYAIVADAPAVNIDASNNASIVHRDPNFADGLHVIENVQLWNALAGSAQIVTDGVTTIPNYKDATHPDELLTPNATYTRGGRSWYHLSNARTAIGITRDARTLVLFTVDGTNGGHGMLVPEVADLLRNDYGVWNALNLDGGGSTTMALEDPVTHVRALLNSPADNPPRAEATNLAVYSDGVWPVTTAAVSPAPNAAGWNNGAVTVLLEATDLASGILDTPAGWVEQIAYALSGAQPASALAVAGSTASFAISAPGVTTVTYRATDAAGNEEVARTLDVRVDTTAPVIEGMPGPGCSLWPPNHLMRLVATVTATDAVSGVAPGSFQVTMTSNQANADGDFFTSPAAPGALAVWLRAARLGTGDARVYTLTATATDLAGNTTTAVATCTVPHDQRKP